MKKGIHAIRLLFVCFKASQIPFERVGPFVLYMMYNINQNKKASISGIILNSGLVSSAISKGTKRCKK